MKDIPTIPGELFAKFQTGFYADPTNAVFEAVMDFARFYKKRRESLKEWVASRLKLSMGSR